MAITTYTTTAKIREDSGFKGNTYILDASIDVQRIRAWGSINSYVGTRYKIPDVTDPNFVASPASYLLESVEIMLGGALLLINEYGSEGRDTDKDGYLRKTEAEKILADIRDGKVALFGLDGNLLPSIAAENSTRGKIRGYVNETPLNISVDDTF